MTLAEKGVVRAVRKSIRAVLVDRPRDWEESLADAADALEGLLIGKCLVRAKAELARKYGVIGGS